MCLSLTGTPARRKGLLLDCACLKCLCYKGTRNASQMCNACTLDMHPGDPRPYKPVKVNTSASN
jgi:hypothetical protein